MSIMRRRARFLIVNRPEAACINDLPSALAVGLTDATSNPGRALGSGAWQKPAPALATTAINTRRSAIREGTGMVDTSPLRKVPRGLTRSLHINFQSEPNRS